MAATLVGCRRDNAIDRSGDGSSPPGPDASSKKDSPTDMPWDPGPDTSPKYDTPTDMPWDPGPDTSPQKDAPADLTWTWEPDLGGEAGHSNDTSPDAPGIDANLDATVLDGAGTCRAGYVLGYTTAGCGTAAKPVCAWANQDACAKYACGCSGKLIAGCDFFSEPWYRNTDPTKGCGDLPNPIDGGVVDGGGSETGIPASGSCPSGTVLVTPIAAGAQFNAFCGRPCATTANCPTDFHCVDLFAAQTPSPGPVCVSTTTPPPVSNPYSGWHWDGTPSCRYGNILGALYNEPITQVAGLELVTCANGCVATDDAGPVAHCR